MKIRHFLLAALWFPLLALGQTFTYPSVTFQDLTVLGTCTGCTGSLGPQAANTVLANATALSAAPTAVPVPSCSTSTSALQWTSNSGFICNSSVTAGTISPSAWASPGAIGSTSPNTGAFTTLSASTTNPSFTFTSSGTGATARSYQAKMGDIVSAMDFGALANNSHNDTAAIQAAISYACNSFQIGATVYLPPGQYLVNTGAFNSMCNGLHIEGAGVSNTTLNVNASAQNSDLFDFNTVTGAGIGNLSITYLGSPTSGITISNTNTYNFTVHDVRITGAYEAIGILGLGVPQFYTNIDIENVQTGGTGIYVNGGSDQYFTNILIYAPSNTPAIGMHIQNSGGVFIDGMDVVHNQTGLLIDPPNGSSVAWLSVLNADFDSNTQHGIYFNPASGGTVYGSTFTNVWASSNSDIGVYLSSGGGTVSGVRFIGLRAFNNGQDGLVLNASSGSVLNVGISDSDFSGNSQSGYGTYNGITIGAGMGMFQITGCRSGQLASYANSQKYGILVNTGASNNYMITNNNTLGNVTAGVQDNGTGATKVVGSNL